MLYPQQWTTANFHYGPRSCRQHSYSWSRRSKQTMQSRLEIQKVAPHAWRVMSGLETYVRNSGLEPALLLLVKLRASQINGCAFCIDMHTQDARAHGESEQRLYAVTAWPETPFFTDRERSALAWTEAITLINETHA